MKTKLFFLFILSLLLTACDQTFRLSTSSEDVGNLAATIADFDLPSGYAPEFSTTVMGYELAVYSRSDGPGHIYLIQSSDPADVDRLAQALDQIVIGSSDPTTHLTVIETRSVVVRGLETTLVISEAVNGEGFVFLQAAVGFQGNGGPALLVYSEPLANWDETTLNSLLASFR